MNEYVARRSRQGVSKTDIIAINGLAKADAASGNKVINASIGTFLDENKKVGGVSLIKESLSNHINDNLGYPGVRGDLDYCQSVMNYVFGDRLEKINSLFHPFIGATLGGTGAVSQAFNLFLEEGDVVLLPDVMWTNYKLIATKAKTTYTTFTMFDDKGGFNLASLKDTIEEAFKTHGRVLTVINDPCQNPTGYCLSEEEYDALFALLNEEGKNGNLVVLFDIAYISFFHVEGSHCALVDKLSEDKTTFLPLVAFSCSKVFGLYGLRVGALIALCPDKLNQEEVSRAFGAQARGTYSVPVGPVQHAVSLVLNDKDKIKELDRQIQDCSDALYKRSIVLMEELKKYSIASYPYKAGFFITLKVPHAFDVYDRLKARHMYVVPMNEDSIRLALSGMTEEEIRILIRNMKECMVD